MKLICLHQATMFLERASQMGFGVFWLHITAGPILALGFGTGVFFLHQIACLDFQESIDTLFAVIGKVGAELCPREVPKNVVFSVRDKSMGLVKKN